MRTKWALVLAAAVAVLAVGATAVRAEFLTVYGGPTYDPATGIGFKDPVVPQQQFGVNDSGVAIASANAGPGGEHAMRWDASGALATVLEPSASFGLAINASGVMVGYVTVKSGDRALRWDPGAVAATQLDVLSTDSSGFTAAFAFAVNDSGTAVGEATKYTGDTSVGTRAVRWDAGSTTATELGNIGTNALGATTVTAVAVNDSGTAVGHGIKITGGTEFGERAIRWDAGSVAATELGNLGTNSLGRTDARALAVNAGGTVVGYAIKYRGNTASGFRAVRWDAGGTAATELANLGTDSTGFAEDQALAVNAGGTAVGYATTYRGDTFLGTRAVRWDASGVAATELDNLGTTAAGFTDTRAYAINAGGIAVGYSGARAVLWGADAKAVDLNTLIDPASGWTLTEADSISDTKFIAGIGMFDPDGAGPLAAYNRAFLINVNSIVPEPSSVGLLAIGTGVMLTRWRWRRSPSRGGQ